jgi:tRNA(Met) C34 N-acetyltransferase TmcA
VLKPLNTEDAYLELFLQDFKKRFISLLAYEFASFKATTALGILQQKPTLKHEMEETKPSTGKKESRFTNYHWDMFVCF